MNTSLFTLRGHIVALLLLNGALNLPAQGTAFTYQGRLKDGGNPASGIYDLRFTIYALGNGGGTVAGPLTNSAVGVTDGLFTVTLDFGAGVFAGAPRWLEIGVRTNGSTAAYSVLGSRQPLTPAPYAIHAASAGTGGGSPWLLNGTNAYYNGGNVGIGTTTPNHRLGISGGPSWTSFFWKGALELENASAIAWQANAGGQRFGIGQTTGGLYIFRTTSDPGTTATPALYDVTIDDSGRVGIGTSTPDSKLTVSSPGYGIEHTDGTIRVGTYAGLDAGWFGTINNYPLSFYVNGGGASMTVDTTGSVGIGTTTPAFGSKLEVIGFSRVSGQFSVNSAAIPDTTVSLRARAGETKPLQLVDSGNVICLTMSTFPNHLLVSGDASKSSGGTSWGVISDRRVKQDVKDYENGLSEVLKLRPVRFHYRDDPKRGLNSANEEVGFIAQEVREVIPDAVTEGQDGYLSLKADPIHWAAITAIQELNAKLEEQLKLKTAEIETLEQRLEKLERRFEQQTVNR